MNSLPLISYHGGHSGELCAHARDSKAQLIEEYIKKGFTQFAITEHVPPPEDSLLYFDEIAEGLNAEELNRRFDEYFFTTVKELKTRYGHLAEILFGFETEYHSADPLGRVSYLVQRYNPELIVASVHHINNLPYDIKKSEFDDAVNSVGGIDNFYQLYFDDQLKLVSHLTQIAPKTPIVVGHIDLPKIFSGNLKPGAPYWPLLERNIEFFASKQIPLEVNTHCFKKGFSEPYPSEEILKLIAAKDAMITLGDDSHGIEEVGHYWKETAAIVRRHFKAVAKLDIATKKWKEIQLVS